MQFLSRYFLYFLQTCACMHSSCNAALSKGRLAACSTVQGIWTGKQAGKESSLKGVAKSTQSRACLIANGEVGEVPGLHMAHSDPLSAPLAVRRTSDELYGIQCILPRCICTIEGETTIYCCTNIVLVAASRLLLLEIPNNFAHRDAHCLCTACFIRTIVADRRCTKDLRAKCLAPGDFQAPHLC